MPSPSFGYFGQSKASATYGFSWKVVETNSRLGKLNNWRPPQSPANKPEVINANMLSANAMLLSSRYDPNAVTNDAMTPDVGEDARKDWEKNSQESEHSELEVDKQMILSITVSNEKFQNHMKNDISVILEEDRGTEMNNHKLILETELCRDLTGDDNANNRVIDRASRESSGIDLEHSRLVSQDNYVRCTISETGTRITTKDRLEEEKSGNSAVTSHDDPIGSQTGDVNNSGVPKNAMLRSNSVCCVQDLHKPSCWLTDKLGTSDNEEFLVPNVDKSSISKEGSSKNLVGDLQNYASAITKILELWD